MFIHSFARIATVGLALTAISLTLPRFGFAQAVPLQNATATFSQTQSGNFFAARAIDGVTNDNLGWAIFDANAAQNTTAQTAVFETVSDAGIAGGTRLTFNLTQAYTINPGHTIGRFRLSATTDARSQFADGLQTGGDVTANWTILAPQTVASANGASLSVLGDNSVLSGGTNPGTDTYTVTALTGLTGITGIRLEVLEDASLPTSGPGRFSTNGNFVLSEFSVAQSAAVVPEASPLLLLSLGAIALQTRTRRKSSSG